MKIYERLEKNELELIRIAYNSLKMKFEDMYNLFESKNNDKTKVRVFILDITFIYNFLFGFFIKSRNPELIFDKKYFHIHIIEILNLLAHYRRFFYNKLNCDKNYLLLYKSFNPKQERSIYNEIYLFLDKFAAFIPDLYILNMLELKELKYFYHFYQIEFFNKYKKDIDFKTYIFSNENTLKNCLYSISNEYFENTNYILIEGFYQNNKIYLDIFENIYNEYKFLFENEDRLIRKKAKESFFNFTILQLFNQELLKQRKNKKVELFTSIIENKIEYKDLVKKHEYEKYLNFLADLKFDSTNNFTNFIKTIINNKKVELYNKELLYINNEYLTNFNLSISIEWLLNLK